MTGVEVTPTRRRRRRSVGLVTFYANHDSDMNGSVWDLSGVRQRCRWALEAGARRVAATPSP